MISSGRGVARCLIGIAAAGVTTGCGGDRALEPSLATAPAGVVAGCRYAAATADLEVRCPAIWPNDSRRTRLRSLGRGRNAYLLEAQTGLGERTPVFHILIGGQVPPFRTEFEGDGRALEVTTRDHDVPVKTGPNGTPTGETWPVERLTRRVRYVNVAGRRGALLRAPSYPLGGIHGGHSIVMWNEGDHGYLVSTHSERSARAAARVAIELARSMRPVD